MKNSSATPTVIDYYLLSNTINNLIITHQGEQPGDVVGQLPGEELVGHPVRPPGRGGLAQVAHVPREVVLDRGTLAGATTKEGHALGVGPGVGREEGGCGISCYDSDLPAI